MTDFFDNEGNRIIDPFCFDELSMIDRGVKAIRFMYGITGAIGLVAGLALLFWPARTLIVLAIIIGAYFVLASVTRIGVAVATPFMPSGWRALNIFTGLLLMFCGIVIIKHQATSAAVLTTLGVIAIGFGWIIEGIVTLIETGMMRNRAVSILAGVLSILAGIVVLLFPLESVDLLILFASITLSVLGGMLLVRAFTFGKSLQS